MAGSQKVWVSYELNKDGLLTISAESETEPEAYEVFSINYLSKLDEIYQNEINQLAIDAAVKRDEAWAKSEAERKAREAEYT